MGFLYSLVRAHMRRGTLLLLIPAVLSMAGCEDSGTRATKSRMVGTWIAESQEHGGRVQRVLTLGADGRMTDSVRLVAPSGTSKLEEREGEWFFDGVNFKRKYTYVDGKPLTNAHFIYETYELKAVSDSELVGVSGVGRGEVRYQRTRSEGAK
jgi:hypothetical protein